MSTEPAPEFAQILSLLTRVGFDPSIEELERLREQFELARSQAALVHCLEAARYAEPSLVYRARP